MVALDGLPFSLGEGQAFGFVGPNGAGKTTAMRVVLGCWTPTPAKSDGADTNDGRDVQTRRTHGPGYGQTFSTQCACVPLVREQGA